MIFIWRPYFVVVFVGFPLMKTLSMHLGDNFGAQSQELRDVWCERLWRMTSSLAPKSCDGTKYCWPFHQNPSPVHRRERMMSSNWQLERYSTEPTRNQSGNILYIFLCKALYINFSAASCPFCLIFFLWNLKNLPKSYPFINTCKNMIQWRN